MKIKTLSFQVTFFLLLPYFLFSQQIDTIKKSSNLPILSAGFHLGFTSSDITSSKISIPGQTLDLTQANPKFNANARIGIQILIHLGANSGLETGIIYEKNGMKTNGFFDAFTGNFIENDNATTQFSFEYFTIPLLFKKKFPLARKTDLSLHLGPYFGFLQSASYISETIDFEENPDGTFTELIRESSSSLKELYTRNRDIGFRFQLGAERKISDLATLYAYSFYSRGLTNIATNIVGDEGVHQVFGLSIGGYFRMR